MSLPPATCSSLTNRCNQLILAGTKNGDTAYSLSAMQLGMLFHLIQSPHSGIDIEQIICDTSHPLDLIAFDRAWQKLLVRHSILRTSFLWQQLDEPPQQVHFHVELPLRRHDCRHLPSEQQQQLLNSYLQSDRLQGFSPAVAPLMHLVVFRWTEVKYTWIWTVHHILLDGRSIHLLLQEFLAFYRSLSEERAFDLPPPLPYSCYIAWLNQQTFSTALPYWKKCLQGFAAPTPLPPSYSQSSLTEIEQRHMIQDWNKPKIASPEQLRLHDLFEAQVERKPEAVALVFREQRENRAYLCPSLVTLQAGKQEQKRPLFCIHVLGLGLRYYRSLLPYLDHHQTVYGLSTQLTERQVTSQRVEALASHYVEQIQQVQPQGPYLLLGFSFGGLIAYEMAQQLQSQGQTVALLGLLDTRSIATKVATNAQGGAQTIAPLLQWTQNLAVGGLPYLVASLRWQGLKLAVKCFQSARLPMTPRLQEALYTMQNIRYGREYKPKPYAGQVTLFKAAQQFESVSWDLGWSQLALGGLHVHTIPGNHEKIFEKPNAQVLGQKLNAVISTIS